jgi:isopentenyl-diphosphate delta-isomerase
MQQRCDQKILFPNHWANTCCSHPLHDGALFLGEPISGEMDGPTGTIRAAVRAASQPAPAHAPLLCWAGHSLPPTPPCPRVQRRKLQQELGVPPSQLPADCFQFITRVHYKAPMPGPEPMWGEHEIDYLLIARPEVRGHLPRPGAPRAGPR